VIVAAALCPCPPLLAAELTGQADILPELRDACAAALASLLATAPDVVAVVGPAETTGTWDPGGELSLASYAPVLRAGGPLAPDDSADFPVAAPPLPLALGIGALLLDKAGHAGPRIIQGIAGSEPAADCLALGRKLAASAPRVALLAVGDGTARRSPSAPGYLDERAAAFDESVARAVRDADLPAIAALDSALATDLMAVGRPAWQALAGALLTGHSPAGRLQTEILYSDAPLGVAYLVATLTPSPAQH
jgi:hypothetical protein